ncbi:hypothetical protein HOY82DRAFT_613226 [Tuber indicum]|nr:hypothetical protein HOY82DRAFT_613226 [Tuber indicum]
MVKSLSSPGMGIPPYMVCRIASGILLAILTYGADLLIPILATLDKMSTYRIKVLRWITNCFSSTPSPILACEACLPPIAIVLTHRRRMAALHLTCSSPLINPAAERLPPDVLLMDDSDLQMTAHRIKLLTDWSLQAPPDLYYHYPVSTRPHAFIGLDRFIAGRIYQICSGKSYLSRHHAWDKDGEPSLCWHSKKEDANLHHAILTCTAKADLRVLHLPGVSDGGPDLPIWTSVDLIKGLANYITHIGTGFPSDMPAFRSYLAANPAA